MTNRAEKALDYRKSGMNCAQSVALAFADMTELDPETIAAMTQPFGGGIGGSMEGTCGAIVGACMMLGLIEKEAGRPENMKKARQLILQFKEQNQSVVCKDLKGIETGTVLRPCPDCIADAASFLETLVEHKV